MSRWNGFYSFQQILKSCGCFLQRRERPRPPTRSWSMLYSFPRTKMLLKIAGMKFKLLCGLFLVLTIYPVLAGDSPGLRDTTILIIRHAEKPDAGYELAPAGQERARAYVNYFKTFTQ